MKKRNKKRENLKYNTNSFMRDYLLLPSETNLCSFVQFHFNFLCVTKYSVVKKPHYYTGLSVIKEKNVLFQIDMQQYLN